MLCPWVPAEQANGTQTCTPALKCSVALRFGKRGGSWALASDGICRRCGVVELVARGHEVDQVGDGGIGGARVVDDFATAEEIDAIADLEHLAIVVGDQDDRDVSA